MLFFGRVSLPAVAELIDHVPQIWFALTAFAQLRHRWRNGCSFYRRKGQAEQVLLLIKLLVRSDLLLSILFDVLKLRELLGVLLDSAALLLVRDLVLSVRR